MRFFLSDKTILAFTLLTSTLLEGSAGLPSSTDDPFTNVDCSWKALDPQPGVFFNTCNNNPDNLPFLAQFFTSVEDKGLAYNAYGHYLTCYDLPLLWNKNAGSMVINRDRTKDCWVYTQTACQGDVAEVTAVEQFEGFFDHGVQGFVCQEK